MVTITYRNKITGKVREETCSLDDGEMLVRRVEANSVLELISIIDSEGRRL